jgi:predicted phosphodiesterase
MFGLSSTGAKAVLLLALLLGGCRASVDLPAILEKLEFPLDMGSVRFAVIGDSGTGGRAQRQVAGQMAAYRKQFEFEFVLMLGDNLYGHERPRDYERKFKIPYAQLLKDGVEFYAALGNHDEPSQRFFEDFHMGGERYYAFTKGNARFFALDSSYSDVDQLAWLDHQLERTSEDWKICFLHHPLYSSGREHGPSLELRQMLEPILIKHGVDVVFSGHEHFYERLVPQNGIAYFISGGAGKLRPGDIRATEETARGFDSDYHFMLIELDGDSMEFRAISRTGAIVDTGVLRRDGSDVALAPRGKSDALANPPLELAIQ